MITERPLSKRRPFLLPSIVRKTSVRWRLRLSLVELFSQLRAKGLARGSICVDTNNPGGGRPALSNPYRYPSRQQRPSNSWQGETKKGMALCHPFMWINSVSN